MPRALIINADDLGYEPQVTRGLIESMREGAVSSTTFIVNGPHSKEAAGHAKGLAVGLHLNLARWQKLSGQGEWNEADAPKLEAAVVEREVHAQLERFEKLLGHKATHIDVHKHLHKHAGVLEGLSRAAAAHRLPVRSIDKAMRQSLRKRGVATNDHFLGDAGKTAYWTLEQLESTLNALPKSGVIELMCHPGYAPTQIQSGYSAQREVELATFTSPSALAMLERLELQPVSWRIAFGG
jgi:predicted glycoside hydrolase/deacetylase ChbG (UPF0249 family)